MQHSLITSGATSALPNQNCSCNTGLFSALLALRCALPTSCRSQILV